jgi:hypothetical protein
MQANQSDLIKWIDFGNEAGDDVDPAELTSLSTFFTACRYLARDVKGICCRVTLRTDVWPIVRRSDESLDKMEQYVKDIVWGKKRFSVAIVQTHKSSA